MTTLVAETSKHKTKGRSPTVMKALVYQGPGKKALEERPLPVVAAFGDHRPECGIEKDAEPAERDARDERDPQQEDVDPEVFG